MNFADRISETSEEMVESLRALLKIRSVEARGEGGYPFGTGVHSALLECLALCERLGFKTVNVDNMLGYCEYGEGGEMVAVLGHLDVVPEGDGWTHPPYGGEIADGRLYGRGATDDKGPTVAALYALEAVRHSGLPLSRRIRVMFGLNEETGSAGVAHYVSSGGEIPVTGFTPDGEYPIINGEKGIVIGCWRRPLSARGERVLLSLKAGTAPNVVPDYARAELRLPAAQADAVCAGTAPEKVTFTRTPDGLLAEAAGVNAHGSTPEQGENAIGRLLLALEPLALDGDSGDFVRFMNRKLGMETRGKSLGIAMRDELSGDLIVNLGMAEIADGKASITLNLRSPVTRRFEDFIGTLRAALAQGGFEEVGLEHQESIYMPPECELIRALSRVYEEQTGDKARLLSIGGGTYAKAIPHIVAFGPIFPGDEITEHKADEYIALSRLKQNAEIIAAAMYELAK